MQSFRQYRKFRSTVKSQLERDKLKAQGRGQQEERHDETHPSAESTSSDPSKESDLEKGHAAADGAGIAGAPTDTSTDDDADGQGASARDEKTLGHDRRSQEARESVEETNAPGEGVENNDDDDDDDDEGDWELSQQRTLSRISSQQSTGTGLGTRLTGVNIRKRTTREGGEGNVFVVNYEGPDDPNDPHNWSYAVRVPCTFLIALIGCVVGVASAIDSAALQEAAKEFHVSEVVESMATGLFLIGFGVGALFAGPISETVGRNPVYIVTLLLYMIFLMGSALSPNIGAQLAFRFLAGIFGSTPLTCAGGSISDLWDPMERVFAFPIFANAAFTGPLLGPVMGGFIAQSSVISWRWVEWVTLIFSGLVLALVTLFLPETYPPILLKWKAESLRKATGDDRYKADIEIRQQSFAHRLKTALWRPFFLTAREPIIQSIALYLTVIYIVLFTFLDGYDFIFTEIHGTSQGITGLCFLGIILGLFGASALVPVIYHWAKRDLAKIKEAGGDRLPPEFRLWYCMLGGSFAIPISLFWMGWTSDSNISIWSPLAASVLFGYGILCVFISSYQYIIDSYEVYAASALASITLIRYVAAGGMTIVGIPMYKNLGVHFSLTILACLGALLVPLPYLFFAYGPWIRSKSRFAINADPPKASKS